MKNILSLLLLLLVVFSFYPSYSYASEDQDYSFAVDMIYPANQIGTARYYHVPGKPDEQITLMAKLTNLSNQSLDIEVVAMNAYSSQDGIFYQSPIEVNSQVHALGDERYGLAQYMTKMDSITLLPNASEVVSILINIPDLNIGTLLGGIRFVVFEGTHELQEADKQNGIAQILLDKYHAIDTAIQIDLPQKDKSSVSVSDPTYNGDKTNISVWINNQSAIIQENISGTYAIFDNKDNLLFDGVISAFKMSPMAEYNHSIAWQYKTLEEGTYTLTLSLNNNGEIFSFDKTFEINRQDVTKSQQAQEKINPEIRANYPVWFWYAAGLFSLFIIILLIMFLRLRRRSAKR